MVDFNWNPNADDEIRREALANIQARVSGIVCPEHKESPTAFVAPDGNVSFRVCCPAQDERLSRELPRLLP